MPRFGDAQYETTQKVLAAISSGKMTPVEAVELLRELRSVTEGMSSTADSDNVGNQTH